MNETRESDIIIEDLIASLENMIDAQDDMWEEEKYSNYKEVIKIREERLKPSKEKFKTYLDEYMDQRIEKYIQKFYIKKTIFSNKAEVDSV